MSKSSDNYTQLPISKVMLKILLLGIRFMWAKNFQMSKLGLEKAEEP